MTRESRLDRNRWALPVLAVLGFFGGGLLTPWFVESLFVWTRFPIYPVYTDFRFSIVGAILGTVAYPLVLLLVSRGWIGPH